MKAVRGFKFWQSCVVVASVVFTLLMVNLAIIEKEQHLADGKQVLLEMVPVDPRSLMQGDYMRVRFAIEDDINKHFGDTSFAEGKAMLRLDEHNIGRFDGVAHVNVTSADKDDVVAVRFRIREGQVKFATGSFFFQEGKAAHYEKAKYGVFKVNDNGEPLLTDLVVGPE